MRLRTNRFQGAQTAGASQIVAIDMNPEKFELGTTKPSIERDKTLLLFPARHFGATDVLNPKDVTGPVRFSRSTPL